ncbi:MAG: glycosyltransferase family 2 protein [Erysipelotrichaceae bacterium]
MNDLVSIVVPVYNVEKYLKECVDSLIQQTYSHIEIILVDDGSPDQSPLLCDELAKKDHRIIVIHKANGGLSDARNKGINVSKGQYITFVDSDDYVNANFISSMIEQIKKVQSEICIANVNQDSDTSDVVTHTITREKALKYLSTRSWVLSIACAKLYKKSLFENIHFPVGKLHEDEFVAHRLFSECKTISYTNQSTYFYVRRDESITTRVQPIQSYLDGLEAFLQRTDFYIREKYYTEAFLALHNAYGNFVQAIMHKDRKIISFKVLIKSCNQRFIALIKEKKSCKESIQGIICFIYPSWYKKGKKDLW